MELSQSDEEQTGGKAEGSTGVDWLKETVAAACRRSRTIVIFDNVFFENTVFWIYALYSDNYSDDQLFPRRPLDFWYDYRQLNVVYSVVEDILPTVNIYLQPNPHIINREARNHMFTGLVEHLGRIAAITPLDNTTSGGNGFSMTIEDSAPILSDCHIGDSICVNGACLTVTEFSEDWFKVGLAPETLDRTDLGERKVGDRVNLERAMAAHVRFGGHFVQGHVDGTVTVKSSVADGNSLRLTFQLPAPTPDRPSLLPYLIAKGYITLDGASLTLTEVDDEKQTFSVMLIAHTQEKITLAGKPVGAKVNVEVDMVGKYVERAVLAALGGSGGQPAEGIARIIERVVHKAVSDAAQKK